MKERIYKVETKKEKHGFWYYIRYGLGFYRNPPNVEDKLRNADVMSALFLSVVCSLLEILMLVRTARKLIPIGKIATIGDFFKYTQGYFILLSASILLGLYCVLYLKTKSVFLHRIARFVILAYFALGVYFGALTSISDFGKGYMITCFLSMVMFVTVICIWRPFLSILLTGICGAGFIWLLNRYAVSREGVHLTIGEGDLLNYKTFIISLMFLEIAVYFQRYNDAKSSYKLELASVTDDLTGIPNIRKFGDEAKEYYEKCLGEGKKPVYLVFDIFSFQTFNDRFGYQGGDDLLKNTASLIVNEFNGEPVARESGDYFCVLTAAQDYIDRAMRIRESLRSAYPEEKYLDIRVGAYPTGQQTIDARRAVDRAKYAQKTIKGAEDNFVAVYDEKMGKAYKLRQYVLNNVDNAISKGYIKVYYQPVMWTEDGTLCGCEALARWDDPEIGFLSPGMFIPILEEGRQIHKLDLCIYDHVCRRIRECLDANLPVLPVSLNFSRLDFELMDAVGELEKLVEKYDIERKYLHVEITESALTEDIEGLKKDMKRLHDSGYVIWLDDFGSGYSSLNVLKDFDFDLLKIDMEFLKNFNGNEKAHIIVGSIIRLADQLGMMTLTEGVETEEAVEYLKQGGCGRLQGYYYGKPMPYDDILDRIEKGEYRISDTLA